MKKTLTRFLSMFLVLTMLLTAVPMVLADNGDGNVGGEIFDPSTDSGSVSIIGGNDTLILPEGGSVMAPLSANVTAPAGYTVTGYAWSGSATGNTQAVVFNADAVGSYTVTVTVTLTKTEDSTTSEIKASKTIKVEAEEEELVLERVTIVGDDEVAVGDTIALRYELEPAGYEPKEINWYSMADEISVDDEGIVTGLEEGLNAVVFLEIDGVRDTKQIDVVEATTKVTVTEEIIVAVGESENIDVIITPEEAGEDADITYTSNKTSVATVSSSGLVTGKKVGTTTIKVKVEDVEDFDDKTFYVDVIVVDEDLTCDVETTSASSSYKTVKLDPDYNGDEDDVTFRFTKKASRGDITMDSTGEIKAKGAAAIHVLVEALDDDGDVLASCYSGAAFYEENDIEVTMPKGNATLKFSTRDDIEESGNLLTKMLDNYTTSNSDRVYVTGLDSEEGTITGTGWTTGENRTTVQSLGNMTFTVGTKGTAKFSYEIVMEAREELPLLKGTVEIEYDGEVSGIKYTGSYDQALTFGEADFNKYWEACDMDGDLEYIKITKLPSSSTEGTLYASKTLTTSTYKTSTAHMYYYGTFSSGTNKKDLGELTFRPLSTKKTEYTVLIPFTAYGDDKGKTETLNGYIIIDMNEPANDITSRGVFFGTEYDTKEDLTYADQIAEAYEDAMGEDLGYVVFDLPKAEQAHLYSKIPSSGSNTLVAQGEHLVSNLKLWFDDNSSSTLDLEDAAIIPAAGFSGKIVLSYEAYDEDGKNEYEGTITFNVTKKTKSAVFSDVGTSYSWAADSTDFLNYEGIAQGSNGKYNPASNITRGDFMLMLYRAFLAEDYGTYSVTSNFPDVVKGTSTYSQETYQAVGVAKYLGIAQGSNGKYNPTASITREEAMTLIQRTMDKTKRDLDYETSTKASSFTDYSKISTWARSAIEELVSHGVIVGNNNKVNPQSNITRAEMACILHRVITY